MWRKKCCPEIGHDAAIKIYIFTVKSNLKQVNLHQATYYSKYLFGVTYLDFWGSGTGFESSILPIEMAPKGAKVGMVYCT